MFSNIHKLKILLSLFLLSCSQSQNNLEQTEKMGLTQEENPTPEKTKAISDQESDPVEPAPTGRRVRNYDPIEVQQEEGGELQSTVIGNGKFPEEIDAGFMDAPEPKKFCVLSSDPLLAKSTAEALHKALQIWGAYLNNPERSLPFKYPGSWLGLSYVEICDKNTDLVIIIGEAKDPLELEIEKASKKLGKEFLALSGTFTNSTSGSNVLSFIYFNPKHLNGYQDQSDWLTVVLLREIGLLLGFKDTPGTIMEDPWQILVDPKIWQTLDAKPFMSIDRKSQLLPCPACLANDHGE